MTQDAKKLTQAKRGRMGTAVSSGLKRELIVIFYVVLLLGCSSKYAALKMRTDSLTITEATAYSQADSNEIVASITQDGLSANGSDDPELIALVYGGAMQSPKGFCVFHVFDYGLKGGAGRGVDDNFLEPCKESPTNISVWLGIAKIEISEHLDIDNESQPPTKTFAIDRITMNAGVVGAIPFDLRRTYGPESPESPM